MSGLFDLSPKCAKMDFFSAGREMFGPSYFMTALVVIRTVQLGEHLNLNYFLPNVIIRVLSNRILK